MNVLKRGRPRHELSEESDNVIKEFCEQGWTKKAISKHLGVSLYTLNKSFKRMNLEKPLRYGATRKQIIKELNCNYRNFSFISKALNCSQQFVGQVAHDMDNMLKKEGGHEQVKRIIKGLSYKCDQYWYLNQVN